MTSSPIRFYRGARVEVEALGYIYAVPIVRFIQRIASREVDHWGKATFDTYQGILIYKAEIEGRFVIFIVEEFADGGITVTIMLAGKWGDRSIGGRPWNGQDMNFVRGQIVGPMVADLFSP
jgi:hypothetical protein